MTIKKIYNEPTIQTKPFFAGQVKPLKNADPLSYKKVELTSSTGEIARDNLETKSKPDYSELKKTLIKIGINIGIESGLLNEKIDLIQTCLVFFGGQAIYNKLDQMGVYDSLNLSEEIEEQLFTTFWGVVIKTLYSNSRPNLETLATIGVPIVSVNNLFDK